MTFAPAPIARAAVRAAALGVAFAWCVAASAAAANAKRDPTRPDGDRLLTPSQLRACVAKKEALRSEVDTVVKEKARLDAEKVEMAKSGDELAEALTTIDRTSAEAVDGYNLKVGERDKAIEAYQAKVTAYNDRAEGAKGRQSDYDRACGNRRYDERDLVDVQKPEAPAKKRKK